MATSSTDYSSKAGNVGTYRLKLNISRIGVDEGANTSQVRIRMWMQSFNNSSFNVTSDYAGAFEGSSLTSGSKRLSCTGNGELLVFNYTRTISHNSQGNRSVTATANFSNSLTGYHSAATTLKLNRINQKPDAPSPAPKVTRNGLRVTATSYTPDGNGNTILDFQVLRRDNRSGSYGGWTTANSKSVTFTAIGDTDYQFMSRASTVAGWGDYSSTRTYHVPADTSGVGSVDTVLTPGSVTGVWEKPDTEAELIEYNVYLHDGTSWGSPVTVSDITLEYAFTGLSTGTYMVGVEAVYVSGTSPRAESDPVFLGNVPATIGTVTLTDDGNTTWTAPSDGGSPISSYDVEWFDGIDWVAAESTTQLESTFEGDPLPGIGYRSRVRAVNTVGPAAWQMSPYHCLVDCGCTV